MSVWTGAPVASIRFTWVIARMDPCPVTTQQAAIRKTRINKGRTIVLHNEHLAKAQILLAPQSKYKSRIGSAGCAIDQPGPLKRGKCKPQQNGKCETPPAGSFYRRCFAVSSAASRCYDAATPTTGHPARAHLSLCLDWQLVQFGWSCRPELWRGASKSIPQKCGAG